MKPPAFDYIRVDTLDEALSVLADSDLEAKVLAGGQSLLPMLNMRLARPKALVDINRLAAIATLGRVETDLARVAALGPATTFLEVGALVRQRQLEGYVFEEPRIRLIHTALTYVGHPQTRNQGTVGGAWHMLIHLPSFHCSFSRWMGPPFFKVRVANGRWRQRSFFSPISPRQLSQANC